MESGSLYVGHMCSVAYVAVIMAAPFMKLPQHILGQLSKLAAFYATHYTDEKCMFREVK